ncbi:MAG: hypothetical protein HKN84_16440 [Gammaproteobacteria bacterium]|nr:hypothetical protein [Gammaproteobacteria bacterium]
MVRSSITVLALVLAAPAWAQLEGVIDVHVHSAPDSRNRSLDAFEVARMARRTGMRAVVMKNHYTQTASLAYLVSQIVPDVQFFGGIALNNTLGGVNPAAVEHMALTTGGLGKVVWLPTFDSEHGHLSVRPNPLHVPVMRDGEPLPEVLRVFELVAQYDLSLATGHSSPDESLTLIPLARAAGVERIIVTHPDSRMVQMSIEQQREAAAMGAWLEYPVALAIAPAQMTPEEFAERIRAVGPEHVILSTDLGQVMRPTPADGFAGYIGQLREAGFSEDELDAMTKHNPARFLGLE